MLKGKEKKVGLSEREKKDKTLFDAVGSGDPAAVARAIADGADPNARWDTKDKNFTALHLAIMRGDKAVVEALLRISTVDVNAQNGYGSTALCMAVHIRKAELVELLLMHNGTDLNAGDKSGQSPWDYARNDETRHGERIRSALARREGTSWADGERKRGYPPRDYSQQIRSR
jgi:ankyrin repeat protein